MSAVYPHERAGRYRKPPTFSDRAALDAAQAAWADWWLANFRSAKDYARLTGVSEDVAETRKAGRLPSTWPEKLALMARFGLAPFIIIGAPALETFIHHQEEAADAARAQAHAHALTLFGLGVGCPPVGDIDGDGASSRVGLDGAGVVGRGGVDIGTRGGPVRISPHRHPHQKFHRATAR